jgi:hypothetical protein
MTSHCGHSFCAPCYHELVRHSNTCALCREPFASTPPNVNVALRGVCAAAFPEEFLARSEEGRREEDELARARSAELARANDASRDRGGGINARANDDENDEGGINLMGLQGVFCLSLSSLLCSHDEPRRRHQNNNNNVNNANVNNNNNNNVNNGGHNNNHADEGEGLVEDQS